jgi:hypothetical protein
MKLVINDKEYTVCDNCGTFKSSDRCYNCRPLIPGDLDVCYQLRQYYGIPTKTVKEKKQLLRKKPWTNTDQNKLIKHHLLEYYFTKNQLEQMNLYNNVPDWQLLETTAYKHHRKINGYKLHLYKFKGTWERYKTLTESQIRELINNIPKAVIETFKK